jgi:eukaryotic-like serine/threonine-protein kinase
MARVFTITEGLENMGALKTGGQGSVYKGKRIGEIITAIKILPTPIHSETVADKNYTSFQNEVLKLKKVNETPNPNVVTILHSGITESGNFPFIEMEYIEGPDLGELLTPPHDPVFPVKDVIKVAEQLSNALAHCHRADVKHGDIKSNNVKFNSKTGNYILLDFGLSVMSDEQRRTSFRRAGAIEFMAPEQNEGHMYFQTDVYSFGVVVFELIAGVVPFPLSEKGESARNNVMLAHMEQPVPDAMELRRQHLPADWPEAKKQQEMQVPEWLLTMAYICMQKKPEHRFANGIDLHNYVLRNTMGQVVSNEDAGDEQLSRLQKENDKLRRDKADLEQLVARLQEGYNRNLQKADAINALPVAEAVVPAKKRKTNYINLVAILIPLIAFAVLVYVYLKYDKPASPNEAENTTTSGGDEAVVRPRIITSHKNEETETQLKYAAAYAKEGNYEPALVIYKNLVAKEVPEAMYHYGNLALQNINKNTTCKQAIDLLESAAKQNYLPAKTTLGFLYSFADEPEVLQQNGYEPCVFTKDITRGSRFLMEAMLMGDTTARVLLDELNAVPDTVQQQ